MKKAPVNNNTKLLLVLIFGVIGIFIVSAYVNNAATVAEAPAAEVAHVKPRAASDSWLTYKAESERVAFKYPKGALVGQDEVDGRKYYWLIYSPSTATTSRSAVQVELSVLTNDVCTKALNKNGAKETVGNVVAAVKRGSVNPTARKDAVYVFNKATTCFGVNEYLMDPAGLAANALTVAPTIIQSVSVN